VATQKRAVALQYTQGSKDAPVVTAKGKGRLAEQMVELARANGVPVREDRNLVQVLSLLNIDQEIPPEAYQAVAAILAFIYRLNQKR
jgi:flagellar biosynthesis protein